MGHPRSLENPLKRGGNTNSGNRGETRVPPICRRKKIIRHFNLNKHNLIKKKHIKTNIFMLSVKLLTFLYIF